MFDEIEVKFNDQTGIQCSNLYKMLIKVDNRIKMREETIFFTIISSQVVNVLTSFQHIYNYINTTDATSGA